MMDIVLAGYTRVDFQSAIQARLSDEKPFAPPDIEPGLQAVNDYYNRTINRVPDFPHDHWAEPGETQVRGYGDCEDLAIIKAWHLIRTGRTWQDMSLFVGKFQYPSTSSSPAQNHAMLVVRGGMGEPLQGLDSNYPIVRPFEWWLKDTHPTEPQIFVPIYSVTPLTTSFYSKVAA